MSIDRAYELPAQSRVAYAIIAAGETPKQISTASTWQSFRDGQKVHVPARIESGGEAEDGLININTADQKTLKPCPILVLRAGKSSAMENGFFFHRRAPHVS